MPNNNKKEEEENVLAKQAELKALGLETVLAEINSFSNPPAAPQQLERAIKALFDFTVMDGQERALFLYPGLMPMLVRVGNASLLATAASAMTPKTRQLTLKAIFNLSIEDLNLREMCLATPSLVALLVDTLKAEEAKAKQTALDLLANLANEDGNQRHLFQFPGLVTVLLLQEGGMLRSALDVLANLAIDSANQRDMAKLPALLAFLSSKAIAVGEDNLVQIAALDCLNNLIMEDSNRTVLAAAQESGVVHALCHIINNAMPQSSAARELAWNALFGLTRGRDVQCKQSLAASAECCNVLIAHAQEKVVARRALYHLTLTESVYIRYKLLFANAALFTVLLFDNQDSTLALLGTMTLANLCGASEEAFSSTAMDALLAVLQQAVQGNGQENWTLVEALYPLRFLFTVKQNCLVALERSTDLAAVLLQAVKLSIDARDVLACELGLSALLSLSLVAQARAQLERIKTPALALLSQIEARCDGKTRKLVQAVRYQLVAVLATSNAVLATSFADPRIVGICWDGGEHSHGAPLPALARVETVLQSMGITVAWKSTFSSKLGANYNYFAAMNADLKLCSTVFVLMSKTLQESALSALEMQLASRHQIIPLLVEDGFDWTNGWLADLSQPFSSAELKEDLETRTRIAVETRILQQQQQTPHVHFSPSRKASFTSTSSSSLPNSEQAIRAWLETSVQGGSEIAQALLANGINTASDLKLLLKQPPSEVKKLADINASQAIRLKEAWRKLM